MALVKHSLALLIVSPLVLGACVQKSGDSDLFQNKLLCADKGRDFVNRQRRDDRYSSFSNEMYNYDQIRNTCLLYYEVGSPNGRHHIIKDLSTNEELYSFMSWLDQSLAKVVEENCEKKELKESECLTRDEFMARRDDLFKP